MFDYRHLEATDYRHLEATLRAARSDWYRIRAADDASVATIDLYDEIGFWGTTAADFVRELRDLDVAEIQLHINSPGGEVFDAIAILNALRAHPARVIVTVDGLAASAASFIAMAGDQIIMARNSEMMIHDPRGLCIGNATDMQDMAARLDQVANNMASIYVDRAGGTVEAWREAMRAETWYLAEEAVTAGLADRVLESGNAQSEKARFDLSVFAYAGRAQAPTPHLPRPSPAAASDPSKQEGSRAVAFTDEQLTTMRHQLGLADDADETAITDAFAEALDALAKALAERADPPAQLPDGVVTIDATQLAELQARARRGEEARTQQESDERIRLVDNAIHSGRIPPARREHWLAQLEADLGAAATLQNLAPGLVPVDGEIGHAHSGGGNEADDALYAALFGATQEV